jgi:DNA-binding CsgD family transcriptional regulator
MMGVFRGKHSTFFKEDETEVFGELIPHVKQTISLSEHLARVDLSNRVAFEALDCVSIGLFIAEQSGRIVHTNQTAKQVIGLADGISIYNGVLKLHSKDDDRRLRKAVWDAAAPTNDATPPGEAIAAIRPSGSEAFPLLVCRLWGNHLRYGLGRLDRPLAAIFVTIPGLPHEAPAELLRRIFGLTRAEARICERLVAGMTVEKAATDLGIAIPTARTQLKSIFAKTGVKRQAELVAKIMATPLWLSQGNFPSSPSFDAFNRPAFRG